MNQRNSAKVVHIDTAMHRCTQMSEDVTYPLPDYRQGRDCKTPVPAFSMLAGEPEFSEADNKLRATVWRIYSVLIAALVAAVVISVVTK